MRVASLALAGLVLVPVAVGGAALFSVSELVVAPDALRAGDAAVAEVDFAWARSPCEVLSVRVSPCRAVMEWRVSLDGPFGSPGSVPLARGERVYEPDASRAEWSTVTQPFAMPPVAPGPHRVHLLLNVRVLTLYEGSGDVASDLLRWAPGPALGCGQHGCQNGVVSVGAGWVERVADVTALPGAGNPAGGLVPSILA